MYFSIFCKPKTDNIQKNIYIHYASVYRYTSTCLSRAVSSQLQPRLAGVRAHPDNRQLYTSCTCLNSRPSYSPSARRAFHPQPYLNAHKASTIRHSEHSVQYIAGVCPQFVPPPTPLISRSTMSIFGIAVFLNITSSHFQSTVPYTKYPCVTCRTISLHSGTSP